ncbi:MAG: benzoate-CoA ligase family protein [Proteobacteria bacterium]|nr:benzoate-CoA ligase family protein [Pseudomonadota bacterium]
MIQPENVAAGLLARNLERCPDKAAFLCADDTLTHRALAAEAARFANLLQARGVGPGQRVVLVLPDSFAYPKAFLGAMLLGAVPVPVSAMLGAEDYAFILADCSASALVTWEDSPAAEGARSTPGVAVVLFCGLDGPWGLSGHSAEFEPAAHAAGQPGFMLYSSGSTGRPKGVPHAAADLLGPADPWGSDILGVTAEDVVFSASKMSFAYGLLSSLTLPLAFGATAVLFAGKPGPYELFECIARHRPSLFFCVPTLYNLMLRAFEPGTPGCDLSSLRLCYSAGEALPATLCQEWMSQTGVEILDGIGSTEAFNLFLSNRQGRVRCGASGEIVPGFEARLIAAGGNADSPEVPDGTPGNLLIRGPGLAQSYWERPEKTAETMLPGGWLATGDVYVREQGVFSHQGRSDDMLKVGAHWVSPVQVEDALRQHPAVAECAVAALRVEGLLRPCAHVVLKDPGQAQALLGVEILKCARELLPTYMCPVRVVFHNDLPKTPTGKIQRFRLRNA